MQIFIKTLTGRRSNFNFEPENTVRQVKEALQVCDQVFMLAHVTGKGRNSSGADSSNI